MQSQNNILHRFLFSHIPISCVPLFLPPWKCLCWLSFFSFIIWCSLKLPLHSPLKSLTSLSPVFPIIMDVNVRCCYFHLTHYVPTINQNKQVTIFLFVWFLYLLCFLFLLLFFCLCFFVSLSPFHPSFLSLTNMSWESIVCAFVRVYVGRWWKKKEKHRRSCTLHPLK